jgi:fatty-acyl-CoA synthase
MHMTEVTIICGMIETSPIYTQTRSMTRKQVATVGRVHPHPEIRIVDPLSGAVVPRGVQRAVHPRLQRDARLLG